MIETVPGHECGDLGPPLEVELRQDRAHVVLHRLVRQEDIRGDLLVRLALSDRQQDLLLLRGQLRELVGVGAGGDPRDPLEDLLGDRRIQSRSEWYLGAQGQPADYSKASSGAPAPDFVVFNGIANQYKDNPVAVATQGRVRVFVLDAGPNIDSSFPCRRDDLRHGHQGRHRAPARQQRRLGRPGR
jgi:hypothetical protein